MVPESWIPDPVAYPAEDDDDEDFDFLSQVIWRNLVYEVSCNHLTGELAWVLMTSKYTEGLINYKIQLSKVIYQEI